MLGTPIVDVHPSTGLDSFADITEHVLKAQQYLAQRMKG